MPLRSRATALSLLPCALLLTACGSSFDPLAVKRLPDSSLLLPCTDPVLAPEGASDNDLAAERIRVAKAYVDCRDRQSTLADWVRGQ